MEVISFVQEAMINVESTPSFSVGFFNPNAFSYLKFPGRRQFLQSSKVRSPPTFRIAGNQDDTREISFIARLLKLFFETGHDQTLARKQYKAGLIGEEFQEEHIRRRQ